MPDPMWTPDPADVAAGAHHRLRALRRGAYRTRSRDVRRAAAVVGRRPRGVLALRLGLLRPRSRSPAATRVLASARPARRPVVPRRAAELRRPGVPRPSRRRRRDHRGRRGRSPRRVHLGAAAAAGRRRRRHAARARRRQRAIASSRTCRTARRRSSRSSRRRASARSGPRAAWTTHQVPRSAGSASSSRSCSSPRTGIATAARCTTARTRSPRSAPGLPTLRATIAVDRIGAAAPPDSTPWSDCAAGDEALESTAVPFDHPLWVLFSSGTTGLPKGIVHGHGGVLLEHLKAVALQSDLGPGDVFWWYTTPSWMMWNFQVAGLLTGATHRLLRRQPRVPADRCRVGARRALGRHATSAPVRRTSSACAKAGVRPGTDHDLSALRTLGVTGSTLPTPLFHWVAENVGARVQIVSISGGTDVVTAFCGGAPNVAGVAGRDLRRVPRRRDGRLRRGRAQRAGRGRRTRDHEADAVDAGAVLERPGRRRATARRTSTSSPACGATATG